MYIEECRLRANSKRQAATHKNNDWKRENTTKKGKHKRRNNCMMPIDCCWCAIVSEGERNMKCAFVRLNPFISPFSSKLNLTCNGNNNRLSDWAHSMYNKRQRIRLYFTILSTELSFSRLQFNSSSQPFQWQMIKKFLLFCYWLLHLTLAANLFQTSSYYGLCYVWFFFTRVSVCFTLFFQACSSWNPFNRTLFSSPIVLHT